MMNYKPDKNTLIDFLYDELDERSRQKVEQYLAENPEARKELDELQATRYLLGQLKDKKATQPFFFIEKNKKTKDENTVNQQFFSRRFTQTIAGLAAMILLLFLVGAATGVQISYTSQELKISLGEQKNEPNTTKEDLLNLLKQKSINPQINKKDIELMVATYLKTQNDSLSGKVSRLEKDWANKYQANTKTTQNKSILNEQDLALLMEQIKKENLKMMIQVSESFGKQQKEYTENLFAAYARYIAEQREEDLNTIGLNLKNIRENTQEKQLATDRILTQLIQTVNNK